MPYQIHRLSEPEILQNYIQLLGEACRYAERDWTNWSFSPDAGFWGDGASSGNEGIRTVASLVLACSVLVKYDTDLSERECRDLLARATAALRFAIATHVTGTQKCADSLIAHGSAPGKSHKSGTSSCSTTSA